MGTKISFNQIENRVISLKDYSFLEDGSDESSKFQSAIDDMQDGDTLLVNTSFTVGADISISSKTDCKFTGNGLITLIAGNTILNSKAMINADGCVNCDFSFNFNGNNQNNSNDTNGTNGLVGCLYLTNCTRCDVFECQILNCNNVGIYLTAGCNGCHAYNNHSVDSFGTDYKIGNGARDCSIHDNTAVVTRNIHIEDYSGTGTTGKQDGFIGVRFACPNAKVYNNFCDNTNGTGTDQGICAFAGWFKGMDDTFDCHGNTWVGGTSSIQCYLETGVALKSLVLRDTCIGAGAGSGGIVIGTTGANIASVDSLVVDCILYTSNTGLSIESNGGNFTVGRGAINLVGEVSGGLNAIYNELSNLNITGSLKHTGTSHAINLYTASECSVIGMTIEMGAQVARAINMQDSTACRIEGNRIKNNNNVSIRELGTADNNIITGNICNTTITVVGASTVNSNNLTGVA